jgi:hypothetical protein
MTNTLESCVTVPDVIALYESTDGDDDFNTEVVFRIADIAAETDEDLSNSLEYYDLMSGAVEYCDGLIVEIVEAQDSLQEAYSAEEWDQMTCNSYADWESDVAMADAAKEVDDVNVLLGEFKIYLSEIGENATGLYGSDFDFGFSDMLNESFFGDYWGTEMNMDKIGQAFNQMNSLYDKIVELNEVFSQNMATTEEEIQGHVDRVWADYT